MERQPAAAPKNTFFSFLMQLSPAARIGLIVFLLALAMVATGLGVRSVTRTLSPARHTGPSLMVQNTIPPASGISSLLSADAHPHAG